MGEGGGETLGNEASGTEESQPCSPYFPMGQPETSKGREEEEPYQTTEGSQYIQEDLQHGISGSDPPKLQRLLAGIFFGKNQFNLA